jgi:lysophospholipase L1-like esterase
MPECSGFNRINYTPIDAYSDDLQSARVRGLSNVKLRWDCEPDGFVFEHTLNIYGFRGPNFTLARPPDRSRMLFIGDSFVEGAGAADDGTIPEHFNRLMGSDHAVDAVNLGVGGTDLVNYTLLARDSVPLLKPQALFLVVYFNDLPAPPIVEFEEVGDEAPPFARLSPWTPRAVAALSRWWRGEVIPRRMPSGPIPFLAPVPSSANPLSNMALPANVDPEILSAMQRGKANPWNILLAAMHERALRRDYSNPCGARDYLRRIASICAEHECSLVVVYIPHLATTNPRYMKAQTQLGAEYGNLTRLDGPQYRAQQRYLAQLTQALAIPFLDTTEEFIEAEKTDVRMFWPIDGHCTAAGYRLVAEVCARHWLEGAVPRQPAAPPQAGANR